MKDNFGSKTVKEMCNGDPNRIVNVLCYGDSNTYGHIPIDCGRYDKKTRWTGVLERLLGGQYNIIEEGFNGRTTVFDNPDEPWKNGLAYLRPCLNSHKPVDVVILMLGSNDLKTVFHASAKDIADGVERLVCDIRNFTSSKQGFIPTIILMSPPVIGENICESPFNTSFDETAIERSKELPVWYEKVADKYGCIYVRTSDFIESSAEDSLHLTKEAHSKLANVLYDIISN